MVDLDLSPSASAVIGSGRGGSVRTREFLSEIVAVDPVMGDSALLTLTVPDPMAREVRSGHFVDVLCRLDGSYDPLLRRPYSFFRADPRAGTVLDVLGPLGNTYDIAPRSQNVLMVAGGVGVAPLVMLADQAVAQGLNVTFLMGSADAAGLLAPAHLPSAVEYHIATDDGTMGHHGFVTDLVRDYVRWADQIFACGPEPMYRSLRNAVKPHRIARKPRVQVSMERSMACGLGACLGCVVETRHGMQTSCVDGPVYDMDEILWT